MDFPIEDRSAQNLGKLDEKSTTARPSDSSKLPAYEGVSQSFEDDLMREFDQKHSNLSSFLDDRVSDLTSSQSDREHVVPVSKNPFGHEVHEHHPQDFDYEFIRQQEDFKKFGGDTGFGSSDKAGVDSLFKIDTNTAVADKTEPGAGDQKVLDEHEQLMGQFERVSPNMINYGYEETTMTTRSSAHFPEAMPSTQEVPFSTGHQTFSAHSFGLPQQNAEIDDDEDDFEQDSISRQSQSQALSNKLSDSLEALKDIPKEMPPPVQDHFSAPGNPRRRPFEDEDDDFEKDSISSHPLSQKLSDSLEVLKDSPQKDLKFDESLMDLDELPSSKNSIRSISPNEVPNISEDFADVSGVSTLSSQGQREKELVEGLGDASSSVLPTTTDFKATPADYFSSETNFSVLTNMPSENLFSANASHANDDAISNRNQSPLVDFTSIESQGPLSQVTPAAPFSLHDTNTFSHNEPPAVVATTGISSELLLSDTLPEVTDTLSQGTFPDTTSSRYEEEDLPPPIPPHQNLPVTVSDVGSFGHESPVLLTNGGQQTIQDIINPFDHTTSRADDYMSRYGVEDPMLETFERREEMAPPVPQRGNERSQEDIFLSGGGANWMTSSITMSSSLEEIIQPKFYESEDSSTKTDAPLLDVETKDQQSVSEELEEILPSEKEPSFESMPPPSFIESQTTGRDLFSESGSNFPEQRVRQEVLDAEKLVNEVLEKALPKEEAKIEPSIFTLPSEISNEPVLEPRKNEPTPTIVEPVFEPMVAATHEAKKLAPEPKEDVKLETNVETKQPKVEPKPSPVVTREKIDKPKRDDKYEETLELSEDVQQMLNTLNPRSTMSVEITDKISNGISELQETLGSPSICSSIANPRLWFQPEKLHPTVSELVYWRDPKKSGAVLGAVLVVLLSLTFLSLISVIAYTSLAVLSGTLAFRVYKTVLQAIQKTQDGHPFKEYLEAEVTVPNEKAQEVSSAVISYLNNAALKLRSLFLVEDFVDSAKFGAVLYLLTYIGAWFNGLTLVILGVIALFALPKVYETNKTIIDQYLDLIAAKFSEVNAKITAAVPFLKKEKAQ